MTRRHRFARTLLFAATVYAVHAVNAQIAEPNAAGVAMGHLHYNVQDLAANKAFWVGLGGTPSTFAAGETIRFPNVLILLSDGDSSGGTEGSVINHVAFRVQSIAALEELGYEMHYNEQFPGIASTYTPDGERIELFDDALATNIGFEVADGLDDTIAERHNNPLAAPFVSHHVHFYLPESQVLVARNWYVDIFGATPGKRWRYDAADLPGFNLNFSATDSETAATRGRRLDHIGFEIRNLEAFCRALEAKGIQFDVPYRQLPSGFALAFFTDPWGTYIELTEGLGEF
jgi:catechol 2,3-dioxygenase-like lactoylglutathione lyase family enzyme